MREIGSTPRSAPPPTRGARAPQASPRSPPGNAGLGSGTALVVIVAMPPVATILVLALAPAESLWPHTSLRTSCRRRSANAAADGRRRHLTLAVGTGTAWLVTMYRFPGRALLDRLLVIPLAMPTYIVAYCYVELLDYAGPGADAGCARLFGWRAPADYWFPDVRSLGGAACVLSAVLYPYVYLSARASFVQQSVCALEVARTLGRTLAASFREVALPLARPALAAGVALALMECLNDIGAVQYLGVETLTASVYATWLQRSNLGGAAQAGAGDPALRGGAVRCSSGWPAARPHAPHHRPLPRDTLPGHRGLARLLRRVVCALPFLLGFVVPLLVIAAARRAPLSARRWRPAFWRRL